MNTERTQTEKTKSHYVNRAASLIKRFKKESKTTVFDFSEFLSWFGELRQSILSSTWRQYKASMVHYFESSELMNQAKLIESLSNDGCLENSTKTTSNKKKNLTPKEISTIRSSLKSQAKEINEYKLVYAYFESMLCFGMRPNEVHTAEFIDKPLEGVDLEPPILKIRNSKNTNGRSFGEYRYVGISGINEGNIKLLKYAIITASGFKLGDITYPTFEEFYKNLSRRFSRIIKSIWPKKNKLIVLYTCRHQCIADLKNSGYSPAEVALVVGHGNDITASRHYGHKKYGKQRPLPVPNRAELDKIARFYDKEANKLEKVKSKQNRKAAKTKSKNSA